MQTVCQLHSVRPLFCAATMDRSSTVVEVHLTLHLWRARSDHPWLPDLHETSQHPNITIPHQAGSLKNPCCALQSADSQTNISPPGYTPESKYNRFSKNTTKTGGICGGFLSTGTILERAASQAVSPLLILSIGAKRSVAGLQNIDCNTAPTFSHKTPCTLSRGTK